MKPPTRDRSARRRFVATHDKRTTSIEVLRFGKSQRAYGRPIESSYRGKPAGKKVG